MVIAVMYASMRKGWLVVLAVIAILCGLYAWYPSPAPAPAPAGDRGTKSSSTSERPVVDKAPETAKSEPGNSEETNRRTRPTQAPPDRTYIKPPPEYPIAEGLKDSPGFVISPHNGNIVDVRDIPKGTMVADPSFPPEEKKYFRVP